MLPPLLYEIFESFLGSLANLRKTTIHPVCPSAWINSAPTGRIFTKLIYEYFSKLLPENGSFIQIWWEWRVRYMKTNVHIWSYLSEFLLGGDTYRTKFVENTKTHILCSITFFRKSCSLWNNVEKYGKTGQATDENLISACALHAGYRRLQTYAKDLL